MCVSPSFKPRLWAHLWAFSLRFCLLPLAFPAGALRFHLLLGDGSCGRGVRGYWVPSGHGSARLLPSHRAQRLSVCILAVKASKKYYFGAENKCVVDSRAGYRALGLSGRVGSRRESSLLRVTFGTCCFSGSSKAGRTKLRPRNAESTRLFDCSGL